MKISEIHFNNLRVCHLSELGFAGLKDLQEFFQPKTMEVTI
jgi:hypothetical protein